MLLDYANKEEKLLAKDCAAEEATTAGVSRVIPSITVTCSSELRPKIAHITRPE